ncbi:divergent polysaccharide deacetylase family protein [Rahnella sp. SAP-1]|uniref:Divergent polysaccharide deacetylase family protein n=1 Tax=Rouxiella aceris TaxID=2703884 RepID=A0A848MU57_9GAMM|nr:divergent polysaccharide deacetylase family protein [Rouxiella aceris]NMP29444.1 divergent polysaccharide deacetylase family protein [Rouxiella aceris]
MQYKKRRLVTLCAALAFTLDVQAAKLAILFDDFGYRAQNENQVLKMPINVSVAIFPNAPDSRQMMEKAHQQGREILIHLPMEPISKQPLEKNTLTPSMSSQEVRRIVDQAIADIPYAVGINNHQGSKMTSSLSGMQNVMQAMAPHHLFFLDSMTIGGTQSMQAAQGTSVKVIKRNVFLDDVQNDAEIRHQFARAIAIARSSGFAIAIGHPHPSTVSVIQQELANLPGDIQLVRPSDLLNASVSHMPQPAFKPVIPPKPQPKGIRTCALKQPIPPVYATAMFTVLAESIEQTPVVNFIARQWRDWGTAPAQATPPAPPAEAPKKP